MNFFQAVFADDDEPNSSNHGESSPSSSSNPTRAHHQPTTSSDDDEPTLNSTTPSTSWSLGWLIKTLQIKSDWIETYSRDLEEFGSGLKKETEVFREAAGRVVKDLPTSLEIGASKAQVSLESVGQAIDSIGLVVSDIISHGKESFLAIDHDSDYAYDVNNHGVNNSNLHSSIYSAGRYSRFDAQLRAIQCDVNTYVEDPDDVADYNKWVSEFNLEEKSEEVDCLLKENGSVEGVYRRVVPSNVEHDVFWKRYFYRIHKLNQAESTRAKLVKRAISAQDDEELSWDVDDEEEEGEVKKVDGSNAIACERSVSADQKAETRVESKEKSNAVESTVKEPSNKDVQSSETSKVNEVDEASKELKGKVAPEGKTEAGESGKDSDISVVSAQPSAEEDDMGWDEIGDIGSDDDKKGTRSRSPNREELRKRLSVADDDEDLSWDIEDDF